MLDFFSPREHRKLKAGDDLGWVERLTDVVVATHETRYSY